MQQRFFYWIFMIILVIMIGACGSLEAPKVEQEVQAYQLPGAMPEYYSTVVSKHDTAMLLMGDIERAQRALRAALPQQEGENKTNILNSLTNLKKADDGMMTWMHEFKSTELNEEEYRTLSETEIQAYLREEELKIEQVHLDMTTSIAEAQALLAALK